MFHSNETKFFLEAEFKPEGDQPQAIEKLTQSVLDGKRHQVLLGVTGSGKTFTMANVIQKIQKPTLVLAPNKTLAAQLFSEFKAFFPKNAVEYFVSYYDYYQPEAYIPSTDTYIEKDSAINDEIDKLRLSATRSLLERNDVIIVSSVSCIYGLGSPEIYEDMHMDFTVGNRYQRQETLRKLVEIQYNRKDVDFHRGTFRVRGDAIDVFPSYEEEVAVRLEFFADELEAIHIIDSLKGTKIAELKHFRLYPATHYVTDEVTRKKAIDTIRVELRERLQELQKLSLPLVADRLEKRTFLDLEMLEALGFCTGIENYSRHLTGRRAGDPPPTLIDYFPKDYLMIIDESHVTVPQIGGMYRGDRARKLNLVEHGFRLPSALDNRPLNFEEFEKLMGTTVYVSATPGNYELEKSGGEVIEQIIRPTGLIDPVIEVRPAQTQVKDVLAEIRIRVERNERTLVTTLTKKLSEELTGYLLKNGIKVKYLHSDIETIERVEILRDLRKGVVDVIVGINLLREGLDLPEVSLVAILDADKEGFLRSDRSLIQTIGRAARNAGGLAILYADYITGSMERAMQETSRRRKIQEEYNLKHGITPKTIEKAVRDSLSSSLLEASAGSGRLGLYQDYVDEAKEAEKLLKESGLKDLPQDVVQLDKEILKLQKQMKDTATRLEFEQAALLRDKIKTLKQLRMELG